MDQHDRRARSGIDIAHGGAEQIDGLAGMGIGGGNGVGHFGYPGAGAGTDGAVRRIGRTITGGNGLRPCGPFAAIRLRIGLSPPPVRPGG